MFANEDFAMAAAKEGADPNTDDRTIIEFGFARSLDQGTPLMGQIADDAVHLHATHPRNVRGAIDWTAVDAHRPWQQAAGPPRDFTQLAQADLAAANEANPRAEQYAEVLRRAQPVEADLVLARLRWKQNRLDEATALLERSFLGYRATPWPSPVIMESAFDLAIELARTDPARARRMYAALDKPFAAKQHESSRSFCRIVIAPLFDRCGPSTIASLSHWSRIRSGSARSLPFARTVTRSRTSASPSKRGRTSRASRTRSRGR